MTKANENARARVADAERRARRKIKRLQNKGVRTGSVEPFRAVDRTRLIGITNGLKGNGTGNIIDTGRSSPRIRS